MPKHRTYTSDLIPLSDAPLLQPLVDGLSIKIHAYAEEKVRGAPCTDFTSTFSIDIPSEDSLTEFLSHFLGGPSRWNKRRSTKSPGKLSTTMECISNVHKKDKSQKERKPGLQTNCPPKFSLVWGDGVARITLQWCHTHKYESAHFLGLCKVHPSTRSKFMALYEQGYSVKEAIMINADDVTGGDMNCTLLADRGLCPDTLWVRKLFSSACESSYGPPLGASAFLKASAIIDSYTKNNNGIYAKGSGPSDKCPGHIAAICTPLMSRLHCDSRTAGDVLFVVTTSNLDRGNAYLTNLFITTPMGGMPVGMIVSEKEDADSIICGLELYKSICPDGAFYGKKSPSVIITDDSQSIRKALSMAYPSSVLLLCLFHVCQAMWRWLTRSSCSVQAESRQVLMRLFTRVIFSTTHPQYISNLSDLEGCSEYQLSHDFHVYAST